MTPSRAVAAALAILLAACAGTRPDAPPDHSSLAFPELGPAPDGGTTEGKATDQGKVADQGPTNTKPPDKGLLPDHTTAASAGLPGAGAVQALDAFMLPNGQLLQSVWRGDQGWYRVVPMSNGTPDWAKAAWSGPIPLSGLPGSGEPQALSGFIMPNGQLMQGLWRGDQGWYRTVPMSNGTPDWPNAGAWNGPLPLSGLPGAGSMQASSGFVMPNGAVLQSLWRGDQGWYRTVPIAGGTPDWNNAGAWNGPLLP